MQGLLNKLFNTTAICLSRRIETYNCGTNFTKYEYIDFCSVEVSFLINNGAYLVAL